MNDVMRLLTALVPIAGCAAEELPGSYFDVDRTGADNGCTGDGTNFREQHDYRLERRGNEITLAVGDDVWATGLADGCTVTYKSVVWTSQREGFAIDWEVRGEAQVDPDGGTVCDSELDWRGTETYFITNSEHPDVSPGCEYLVQVDGTHIKTVE